MPNSKRDAVLGKMDRRTALASLLLLLATRPSSAVSRSFDNPPVLETVRSQFTMMAPPQKMPDVRLPLLNGKPGLLTARAGEVLLLNIWASWCVNCRDDLQQLAELARQRRRGLSVQTVSVDTIEADRVRDFVDELQVGDLPIFLDRAGVLSGHAEGTQALLPAFGMPITFLIRPDTIIAGYITGSPDWSSKAASDLISYYM